MKWKVLSSKNCHLNVVKFLYGLVTFGAVSQKLLLASSKENWPQGRGQMKSDSQTLYGAAAAPRLQQGNHGSCWEGGLLAGVWWLGIDPWGTAQKVYGPLPCGPTSRKDRHWNQVHF